MKASEIRAKWLAFFESKGHHIETSASLVPHNDPSLLWISAGMAPLKPYFDGRIIPDNPRIANSQKCIRTTDIENVGKTKRHHTFFEMLGNFSFGDYFKKEVIGWAWEFLTSKEWIGFDPDRLSVTVYPEDEEAFRYWHELVGLPEERIYKLEENFWDIGEGPCGPCTEIFYDRGDSYGDLNDPECWPGGENERFLEVWNLVFTQFNHNKDGSYTPLPNKNIDTGAGLERLASILQDVDSNFDTDLFVPIIQKTCELSGVAYKSKEETDIALKVIADHVRTVVFAVGDGVMPSNEGRGYVIRRLLRRAVRYGKTLGLDKPFLYELTAIVVQNMGSYYNEIVEKQAFIEKMIRMEEERFHETLSDGLSLLSTLTAAAKEQGLSQISGPDAFKLYDTYGFPLDLTEDFAEEQGLGVDREGFEKSMDEQRARARAARVDTGGMNIQGGPLANITDKSEFVGYSELEIEAAITVIVSNNEVVQTAEVGSEIAVLLDRTPFYAESGGQIGDKGTIKGDGFVLEVQDVTKAPHGQAVHRSIVKEGTVQVGSKVQAVVTGTTRADIIKNHTATHLLHKALKQVLGDHVNQAGSLVEAERLRFDFSHFGSIEEGQLQEIERKVNEQIWLNIPVVTELKSIDEAKAMGAMALFGEKYGDVVRVVQVGTYSLELCGGCHVRNTSEIGIFKLLGESGIGSGIRRIEAVTGGHAYEYVEAQLEQLKQAAALLKTNVQEVPRRIEALHSQLKELDRENESLQSKLSRVEAGSLTDAAKEVNGVTVLAARVNATGAEALRSIMDELKTRLTSAVIILGSAGEDKVQLVTSVSADLIKKGFHAGNIVKAAAQHCGGGGGGRPDMAQAGGKDPSKLDEALKLAEELVLSEANVI